jgi:integrase
MVNTFRSIRPPGSARGAYAKLIPHYMNIVDHYLELQSKTGLKGSTIITNASKGSTFLYYLQNAGVYDLKQVTESLVIAYCIEGNLPRLAASTRYRLNEFLEAVSDKYPQCSIIAEWLPLIRVTRKNIQYLTDEEADLIKTACMDQNNDLSLCDRAVGLLLYYTGLRACDIANLKLSDIDWDKDEIHIIQLKTLVPLTLPMNACIGNAIYDYLNKERNSDSEFVFITARGNSFDRNTVGYRAAKIFKTAGVRQDKGDRKGTHIFRHRVATKLLENNVAQPIISQTLGHTDPTSVESYLSTDIEHLRDCALSIEKYPLDWKVFDDE